VSQEDSQPEISSVEKMQTDGEGGKGKFPKSADNFK
jgi:hypothetical protein